MARRTTFDSRNKGYFINPAALNNTYPTGMPGWFAIVGSTDTIWIWDTGTSAWVDSGMANAEFDIVWDAATTPNFSTLETANGLATNTTRRNIILKGTGHVLDNKGSAYTSLRYLDIIGSGQTITIADGTTGTYFFNSLDYTIVTNTSTSDVFNSPAQTFVIKNRSQIRNNAAGDIFYQTSSALVNCLCFNSNLRRASTGYIFNFPIAAATVALYNNSVIDGVISGGPNNNIFVDDTALISPAQTAPNITYKTEMSLNEILIDPVNFEVPGRSYQTIQHAIAWINALMIPPSATNPYTIVFSGDMSSEDLTGVYAIPDFVTLKGQGIQSSILGNVDSACTTWVLTPSSTVENCTIKNLNLSTGKGLSIFNCSIVDATAATPTTKVQTLTFSGEANSGQFSVSYFGQTLGNVAYNADLSIVATDIQNLLQGFSTGELASVTVVPVGTTWVEGFTITFTGCFGEPHSDITVDSTALLSGFGAPLNNAISTVVPGFGGGVNILNTTILSGDFRQFCYIGTFILQHCTVATFAQIKFPVDAQIFNTNIYAFPIPDIVELNGVTLVESYLAGCSSIKFGDGYYEINSSTASGSVTLQPYAFFTGNETYFQDTIYLNDYSVLTTRGSTLAGSGNPMNAYVKIGALSWVTNTGEFYDNTVSGLAARDTQTAIDALISTYFATNQTFYWDTNYYPNFEDFYHHYHLNLITRPIDIVIVDNLGATIGVPTTAYTNLHLFNLIGQGQTVTMTGDWTGKQSNTFFNKIENVIFFVSNSTVSPIALIDNFSFEITNQTNLIQNFVMPLFELNSHTLNIRLNNSNISASGGYVCQDSIGGSTAQFIAINNSSIQNQVTAGTLTTNISYDDTYSIWNIIGTHYNYTKLDLSTRLGTAVASASTLNISAQPRFGSVHVTGAVQINLVSSFGYDQGDRLILIFDSNPLVKHNQTPIGTKYPLLLAGSVDMSAAAGTVLTLILDGAVWREVSRTAA